MIIEANCTTGEIIEREMNAEELAQWEADKVQAQTEVEAIAAKESARQEVLAQLGITEEQAKLLLS